MTALSTEAGKAIMNRLHTPPEPRHDVTITISGRAGSGKSALAAMIAWQLRALPHVTNYDDQNPPMFPGRAAEIMTQMGARLHIHVKTVQTPRGLRPLPARK